MTGKEIETDTMTETETVMMIENEVAAAEGTTMAGIRAVAHLPHDTDHTHARPLDVSSLICLAALVGHRLYRVCSLQFSFENSFLSFRALIPARSRDRNIGTLFSSQMPT